MRGRRSPDRLYAEPAHPYTSALLDAIPVPDPTVDAGRSHLEGELPSPLAPPSGCRFRTRCPRAESLCTDVEPEMRKVSEHHYVACHFPMVEAEEPNPVLVDIDHLITVVADVNPLGA